MRHGKIAFHVGHRGGKCLAGKLLVGPNLGGQQHKTARTHGNRHTAKVVQQHWIVINRVLHRFQVANAALGKRNAARHQRVLLRRTVDDILQPLVINAQHQVPQLRMLQLHTLALFHFIVHQLFLLKIQI